MGGIYPFCQNVARDFLEIDEKIVGSGGAVVEILERWSGLGQNSFIYTPTFIVLATPLGAREVGWLSSFIF